MKAEQSYKPVRFSDLSVSLGSVHELPDGFLQVDGPKERATLKAWSSGRYQAARIDFSYGGRSRHVSGFDSGMVVSQIGLKLLAADSCNVVYVMWRFEPLEELVVAVKRNPGLTRHAECGNAGYHFLGRQKLSVDAALPSARDRKMHSLEAAVSGYEISVSADQYRMNIPAQKSLLSDLEGPHGFRTDNGIYRFKMYMGIR